MNRAPPPAAHHGASPSLVGPRSWPLLLVLFGCEMGPTATASGTIEQEVDLGGASTLVVDSLIEVRVRGERVRSSAMVTIEATVTASAADVATRVLDGYQVGSAENDGTAQITIGPPSRGMLSGTVTVLAPRDVDLTVLSRGGQVDVASMERTIVVESVAGVLVRDAEEDLVLRVESGGALIDTPLRSSQRLDVLVGAGDILLALPGGTPSARFEADATAGVFSNHPALPSRPAGVPYRFTSGSGGASVVLTTRSGAIQFDVR